jgi:2-(3-amino-3-carboxypropyl)histidine synthase
MKTYFIPARSNIEKIDFNTEKLPKNIAIVTTIQYLGEMKKVVAFLQTKKIKAVIAGQILGCNSDCAEKIKEKADAFLYVGTGDFHPIGVALRTNKPVFVLNPESMQLKELDGAAVERIRKKRKIMFAKFLSSDLIGVIFTTKPGQSRIQAKLPEKQYPDKRFYYFICDSLNFSELENFSFIECWVNAMCPRIEEDINKDVNILNVCDITM